jgi:hypothetical protein
VFEETGNACLKENEFKQVQTWILQIQTVTIFFLKTEKRDIWKEAERLYNKEFPKTEPKPRQQPNINQIKKFSALLEDISKY